MHANPDGMELVSDWYMKDTDPQQRSTEHPAALPEVRGPRQQPRLLHVEPARRSQNINRFMYREWFPQIMYNHHQTGPAGTVMFAPPFRDPFNYNFDPLIAMRARPGRRGDAPRASSQEGKPGVTMRSGANYSTWWNGGLRTTAYFHNMIGILTETIGNPTPAADSVRARASSCRDGDLPAPIDAAACGTSGSRSTTRSRRTTRSSTSRRATARRSCSTST